MATPLFRTLQLILAGAEVLNTTDAELRGLIMAVIDDDKREMNTPDAADYLNKGEATLKRWRAKKMGPRYRKDAGGSIFYRIDWLREFMEYDQ